jgi:hypothetical protein
MANKMEFALGLSASSFISGLGKASAALAGFTGMTLGLGGIATQVWGRIEKGGALKDLSARAGESVATLYQMEEAFKLLGVSADSVSPMILRLQKSLSGVDEMGNKTDEVFRGLGLNIAELRGMSATKQFEAIGNALSKVNKLQGIDLATRLFGREGAGTMMQISRDTEGFRAVLRDTAADAVMMNRSAEAFDNIGDSITTVKRKMDSMWTGIAEGAAPGIQAFADALNSVDFSQFGQRIGKELSLSINAINLGKFGDYFTLTLQAGVQDATNLLMQNIQKSGLFGDTKPKPNQKTGWGKTWDVTKGVTAGLFAIWDEIGANLGVPGARELSDKRFDQAYALFEGAGVNNGILPTLADAVDRGIKGNPNIYRERLESMRGELDVKPSAQYAKAAQAVLGNSVTLPKFESLSKQTVEASALEKMGFVFAGGTATNDYQRSIANNTARLVELWEKFRSEATGDQPEPLNFRT